MCDEVITSSCQISFSRDGRFSGVTQMDGEIDIESGKMGII